MGNERRIAWLSLVAGLLILAMFAVTVVTGVSQEKFEIVNDAEAFAKALISEQGPLRLIFTFDIAFITIFTTVFIILPQSLKTGDRVTDAIANGAMGAMILCGFLDFVEDLHILAMLESAIKGIDLSTGQIGLQMILSSLKFCASYVSLFLLAFILPSETIAEKILKYSLWFVQLPIGALVYAGPPEWHVTMTLLRFGVMISGFFLLSFNYFRKGEDR